jgi:hypothetical protein
MFPNLFKNNKIIIFFIIIIIVFLIINYQILYYFSLNENLSELEKITQLIEKYLNPENIPVLNNEEKRIAEYWGNSLCPFSKLTSHGLTKEEALLIIDFFDITSIEDLQKLKDFIENIK